MKPSSIQAAWNGQPQCEQCALRGLALFADLQPWDFELIHRPIDDLSLPTGTDLYHIGDPGEYLFTVRSGLVKLTQFQSGGGQRIVRLLSQGDVAGLEAMVEARYTQTATTLQPAEVCRIPVAVIQRLNEQTPRLQLQLMRRWHKALNEADTWLTELSTGTAQQRVARLLLHQGASLPGDCVPLLGREDMGAVLGITTETASRVIAEFRRRGWIQGCEQGQVRVDHRAMVEALDPL